MCNPRPGKGESCWSHPNLLMDMLAWDQEGPRDHCPCADDLQCQPHGWEQKVIDLHWEIRMTWSFWPKFLKQILVVNLWHTPAWWAIRVLYEELKQQQEYITGNLLFFYIFLCFLTQAWLCLWRIAVEVERAWTLSRSWANILLINSLKKNRMMLQERTCTVLFMPYYQRVWYITEQIKDFC